MGANNRMKVLITGGAGFIGSNLCLELLEKNYEVSVIDNLSPQIHGENPENTSATYMSIKDKVKFIQASVTSREDLLTAISSQEAIIHLAAETGTGQSMYDIERYSMVNIHGTSLLLDILTNESHNVKKVIVASSRSIYGEGRYTHPVHGVVYPSHRKEEDMLKGEFEVKFLDEEQLKLEATDEESKIHPSSVYGITKQVQEQMVLTVCSSLGIAAVAFRYQNVYGPGQSLSNPYTGILSVFSTQIMNGNGIQIFEDGKESRDFVYISDVVNATVLGLESDAADGQVFNVGSGVPTDVKTVAQTLINAYGIDVSLTINGKFRIGDIRHNYADLNKAKSTLGFEPKIDFKSGIDNFTKWVLKQEIGEDMLDKSLEEMKQRGLFK